MTDIKISLVVAKNNYQDELKSIADFVSLLQKEHPNVLVHVEVSVMVNSSN